MASERPQSDFDPYREWLEIAPDRRPPTHYDLLGLPPLTDDIEAARQAFRDRYKFVRQFQTGRRADLAHRVLNELSVAVACLTDEKRKLAYDAQQFGDAFNNGQSPAAPSDPADPDSDEPLESKMLRDLLRQLDEPGNVAEEESVAADSPAVPTTTAPPQPPPRQGKRPVGPPPLRSVAPGHDTVPPLPSSHGQSDHYKRTARVLQAHQRKLMALLTPWIVLAISTSLAAVVGVVTGKWLSQPAGDFDRWVTGEAVDMIVSLTFWPGIVVSIILMAWMSYDAGLDSFDYCKGLGERVRFAAIHISDRMAEYNRMFFALLCFLGMSSFGVSLSVNFTL